MRTLTLRTALGLMTALSAGAARADVVFTDSTFAPANYSAGFTYLQDATTTATAMQCAACGNPGTAFEFNVTETTGGPSFGSVAALVGVINTTFSYNPLTQGALASITASVDKNFTVNVPVGFNNTFRPIIEQDGNFYTAVIAGTPLTGPGTTGYLTLSKSGLLASNFVQINPATGTFGTANPNFAGDPMLFGLSQLIGDTAVANTVATTDYDNISLTLVTAVPEPASLALLLAGIFGLAGARSRRQK